MTLRTDHPRFVNKTADFLRSRGMGDASIAIVLGSGLGRAAAGLIDPITVPTSEIPGFPSSTVPGHNGLIQYGRMRVGTRTSPPLIIFQGRIHPYEGGDPDRSSLNMRLSKALGVSHAILTNAAGGVNPDLSPGDLMLHDGIMKLPVHIAAWVERRSASIAATSSYDLQLNQIIEACARDLGIRISTGVYCYVTGPSYETPAEVRMLHQLGADAVGMSTYPEVVEAGAQGIRTVAVSLISNKAAGLSADPLLHEEVSRVGRRAERTVSRLLRSVVEKLSGVRTE